MFLSVPLVNTKLLPLASGQWREIRYITHFLSAIPKFGDGGFGGFGGPHHPVLARGGVTSRVLSLTKKKIVPKGD